MRRLFLFFSFILCGVILGQSVLADELRLGYVEIQQTSPDTYRTMFKVPAAGSNLRLGIYLIFPPGTRDLTPPKAAFTGGAFIERRTVQIENGLAGRSIAIDGLPANFTDVLVRLENLGGTTQTERLSPRKTNFVIQKTPNSVEVATTYLHLGIEHILFGYDHLVFVLALVILVRQWRRVALTVTAFTLAHSITLVAATLGLLNVPAPPVEAAIALSILLVAVETVHAGRGETSPTGHYPWLVAFPFGLLHGLGFAGALAEVGVPQHAIPIALLFFNVGVELGQLLFVTGLLFMAWCAAGIAGGRLTPAPVRQAIKRSDMVAAYCIGIVAAYWLIERTVAMVS